MVDSELCSVGTAEIKQRSNSANTMKRSVIQLKGFIFGTCWLDVEDSNVSQDAKAVFQPKTKAKILEKN